MKELENLLQQIAKSYDVLLDTKGVLNEFSYTHFELQLRYMIEELIIQKRAIK